MQNERLKYEIYQLQTSEFIFCGMKYFKKNGLLVPETDYKLVYTGEIPVSGKGIQNDLDYLFMKFNTDHPEDFKGHSLSVSDIVRIVGGEHEGYYFCDSFEFIKLEESERGESYVL